MPPTVFPAIPQRITVHLGAPSSYAANVTVPFVDYVKNVIENRKKEMESMILTIKSQNKE